MEHCLCNPLFRKLFNAQARVVMCDAVLNYIWADFRLHTGRDERCIFKRNDNKLPGG